MDITEAAAPKPPNLAPATTAKIFDDTANNEIKTLAEKARGLESSDIDAAYSTYREALSILEEYEKPHIGRHGILFANHKRTIEGILKKLSEKILDLDFKAAVLVTVCDYGAYGLKDEFLSQGMDSVYTKLGVQSNEKKLILNRAERIENIINEESRVNNRYILDDPDVTFLQKLGIERGEELYRYNGKTFAEWVSEIKGITVKQAKPSDEAPVIEPDSTAAVFQARTEEADQKLLSDGLEIASDDVEHTKTFTVVHSEDFNNDLIMTATSYDPDVQNVTVPSPGGFFQPTLTGGLASLRDFDQTRSINVFPPWYFEVLEDTITLTEVESEPIFDFVSREDSDWIVQDLEIQENVTSFLDELGNGAKEINLPAEHTVDTVLERMLGNNDSEEARFIQTLVKNEVITTTPEVVALALCSLIRMPEYARIPWATEQIAMLFEGFNIPKELAMGQVFDDGSMTRAACNNLAEYLRDSHRQNYCDWKTQITRVEITGGRALSLQPDLAVVHNCYVRESREADLSNDIEPVVAHERKQVQKLVNKAFTDEVITADEKDILDMLLNATSGSIQSYLSSIGKTGRQGHNLMMEQIADRLENKYADLTTRVQKHIAIGASEHDRGHFHGFDTGLFNIADNLGLESAYLARYMAQKNEAHRATPLKLSVVSVFTA